MNIKFLFIIFFIVNYALAKEQEATKFAVYGIPVNLIKNAKAVIRHEDREFHVMSENSAVEKVSYAITIINSNGIENSKLVLPYDKFSRVNIISAVVYEENGVKVKRIKKSDIHDYSSISGYSLYEDSRVKYIDPNYRNFPFTVEYIYEIKYSGLMGLPDWSPYKSFNISVEESNYKIIVPTEPKLLYKEKGIKIDSKQRSDKGGNEYLWQETNLPAIKDEDFSLPVEEYLPHVSSALLKFSIAGYEGSTASWEKFGEWVYSLNEGRGELSEETKNEIKRMIAGVEDKEERAKLVYNYMQNKTRYVNVSIGIGGWQPISADEVDRVSYGDCKALSNYTKALLDVAEVPSYYTLVRAGRDAPRVDIDFPSNQFNHAILCLPNEGDTIWLECTDQKMPFGYIGTFTDDRDVLLIKEGGGELARAKRYSGNENSKICKAQVKLDNNLNAQAIVSTRYRGLYYDKMRIIMLVDREDKKRLILRNLNLSSFDLTDYHIKEHKTKSPCIRQELKLNLYEYGTELGERVILPLNFLSGENEIPLKTKERMSDIFIRRSQMTVDSILYEIPKGYIISQVPDDVSFSSNFGDYGYKVKVDGQQILFVRSFSLNKGTYSPVSYNEFAEFFEEVRKYDKVKCVLKRN